MNSFSIQTFGCRVNQAEAFQWSDDLQRHGLKYEPDSVSSDIVLVNTCTLTSRADSDARSFIRRVARLNPGARLIVTGCYAERASQELARMSGVWRVLRNQEKEKVTESVLALVENTESVPVLPFRARACVKVQDGCNFQCRFCIVPSVRGRSRSFQKKEVLDRIRAFAEQGFQEVVLTGIHLCSYGRDLIPKSALLDLLQEVEELPGPARVRLSSLDPRFLTPVLTDFITGSEKICPHFHLSLQSGSDPILKRMGRRIEVDDYRRILSVLRKRSPHASLGADIIVGFPGETEDDFARSEDFLKSSHLTYFHVFTYSPRPGTAAASWPQIQSRVKKERARRLKSLSAAKNLEFRSRLVGQEREAVVIKKGRTEEEVLTDNYVKVFIPPTSCPERLRLMVRICSADAMRTTGQVQEF